MSLSVPITAARPTARAIAGSDAVKILRVYAIAMLCIPSDIAIRPLGGASFPAGLVGMFAFLVWTAATLFGLHDPRRFGTPVRRALVAFWIVSLLSYALMNRAALGQHELEGADRYLMLLAAITGIVFLASEGLRSLDDIRRVLRAVSWGGGFCGVVAGLQFWLSLDVTPILRAIPGFSVVVDSAGLTERDAVNRVAGTATHPIELGVVSAMILPLAIWLAIYDDVERPVLRRWAPVALIGVSAVVSVSRSTVVCLAVAMALLVVLLPVRQRLMAIAAIPAAIGAVFVSAHGLLRTLIALLTAGDSDPSIAHRVDTYGYVQQLVSHAPWLGQGVGTYIADNQIHIFDNQYLTTAVEGGVLGVLALIGLFVVGFVAAVFARQHSHDPAVRLLCAALAAGLLAAAVGAGTFDGLSYNMYCAALALVLGLTGAAWRLVTNEVTGRDQSTTLPPPHHIDRRPPRTLAGRTRGITTQGA
jgi:cell division protein FtsW (lipid II flippase)